MDLLMEDYLSDYQTLDLLIQAAYIKQKEDANLQLAYVNANEMIESGSFFSDKDLFLTKKPQITFC